MRLSTLSWILCIICVTGILLFWLTTQPSTKIQEHVVEGVSIGGSFTLTDHTGKIVTDRSWPKKYLLIYFGFTHCPDICPLGLGIMTDALHALPAKVTDQIQALFITIDPPRDDTKMLASYMPAFHEKLIGLTGTEEQIQDVIKKYRVYAQKDGAGQDYMMNHSSFTYLMNPNGELAHVFAHNTPPKEMAVKIEDIIN
jgi:protein SCO1/2